MNSGSISKSKILSLYIEYPMLKEKFSKDALGITDLILSVESIHPISKPEKPKLDSAYVSFNTLQWRVKRDEGVSFIKGKAIERMPVNPPEEQIKIVIDNILLFNKALSYPYEQPSFYLKNKVINTVFGPITSNQLIDFYTTNQINAANCEFRPIDIYSFKNMKPFSFIPLQSLNDEKWVENVMDNPLLQHTILFRTTQNLVEYQPKEWQKKKQSRDEKEVKEQKEAVVEEKVVEVKEQPIEKKEVRREKETPKEELPEKKEIAIEEKPKESIAPASYIKPEEDTKWEDPNKKKRKVRPGQKKEATTTPKQQDLQPSTPTQMGTPKIQTPTQEKGEGAKEVLATLKHKYEESENKKRLQEKEANSDIKAIDKDEEGFEVISSKKKKQKKRPVEAKVNLGFKY